VENFFNDNKHVNILAQALTMLNPDGSEDTEKEESASADGQEPSALSKTDDPTDAAGCKSSGAAGRGRGGKKKQGMIPRKNVRKAAAGGGAGSFSGADDQALGSPVGAGMGDANAFDSLQWDYHGG
jgi:hypothetical protein